MIPIFKVNILDNVIDNVSNVLRSGFIADGPIVKEFENSLGDFIGNKRVVTVNNEANGIILSLYMAGVRPGDEVITSPMACVASTMGILNLFAKVKWCDVDPYSGMIDINHLEKLISEKTKAILFIHWGGEAGDIESVVKIAHKHGIKVVEDVTESFGAKINSTYLGTHGADYTVFSFSPIKHITTSDGGAILFSDENEYQKGKILKRFGIDRSTFRDEYGEISTKSDIPISSYNFYMNDVCAAMGLEQLKNIDKILNSFYTNGDYFISELSNVPGIGMLKRPGKVRPSFWVFTLLAERRDDILIKLKKKGINASKIHLRNDFYTCYGTGIQEQLSGVKYFSEHVLCLPSGWWLTDEDKKYIVQSIKMGW